MMCRLSNGGGFLADCMGLNYRGLPRHLLVMLVCKCDLLPEYGEEKAAFNAKFRQSFLVANKAGCTCQWLKARVIGLTQVPHVCITIRVVQGGIIGGIEAVLKWKHSQ